MLGGTVHGDGQLLAVVSTTNAVGQTLRLVSGGEVVHESRILAPGQRVEVPVVLPNGGWLRAELLLEERYALTALTSCVYATAAPRAGPPRGPPAAAGDLRRHRLRRARRAARRPGPPACSCAH
jgi:hypothetical protein